MKELQASIRLENFPRSGYYGRLFVGAARRTPHPGGEAAMNGMYLIALAAVVALAGAAVGVQHRARIRETPSP
jgi:hypothetical protein